jgi:uncharacterized protein YacL
MSRTFPDAERRSATSRLSSATSESRGESKRASPASRKGSAFWVVRASLIAVTAALCYAVRPFHLRGLPAAVVGVSIALVVLLAESRLRRAALRDLLGGAFGMVLGMFAAVLVTMVVSRTAEPEPTKSFLECAALLAFGYVGLVLGAEKGGELHLGAMGERFAGEAGVPEMLKLLDTSVLIDGRIADICEAQFLDGTLIVPQFVLHELQLVADSGDGLKRQRGRRGLDVLERIRKMPGVEVRIIDSDPSQNGDVDRKLIELARRTGAKLVTNDFNLNKVATVQGLAVLNVNQLANALRPAVLPGEPMRVFILREGKEANQGVAYLDDGTMVVVDGARRFINKNADVIVTSVHQTTAGKMIFGRMDERPEQAASVARTAAGAVAGRNEAGRPVPDASALERGPRPIFPEADAD